MSWITTERTGLALRGGTIASQPFGQDQVWRGETTTEDTMDILRETGIFLTSFCIILWQMGWLCVRTLGQNKHEMVSASKDSKTFLQWELWREVPLSVTPNSPNTATHSSHVLLTSRAPRARDEEQQCLERKAYCSDPSSLEEQQAHQEAAHLPTGCQAQRVTNAVETVEKGIATTVV